MVDLWFRHEVEALARQVTRTTGAVLPLACHDAAGCRGEVLRETEGRFAGLVVLHVRCGACQALLADIAVCEPVTAPRRCVHRAGQYVGYLRGEVMLACLVCDQTCFLASVARRQEWQVRGSLAMPRRGDGDGVVT